MSETAEQTIAALTRAYHIQKRAREEADQLLEEKSRELYQKNKSLEAAMAQLKQKQAQLVTQEKLASIGQLGASLAHELNNPNAFIQNNLVTMGEYITQLTNGLDKVLVLAESLTSTTPKPEHVEHVRRKIHTIRDTTEIDYIRQDLPALMRETLQGTKRISSIANGLRYFANPDLSTRKPLDVNECIKQAQALVHSKGQLLEMSYELGDLPATQGLPLLLSQALSNIIQNAVEAQPDKPCVNIRSHLEAHSIYIDIEDQGIGIEQKRITEIFTPFYSTKKTQNGLGLVIAQHIIDQHGGSIKVESTIGEGTQVHITLPLTNMETSHEAII